MRSSAERRSADALKTIYDKMTVPSSSAVVNNDRPMRSRPNPVLHFQSCNDESGGSDDDAEDIIEISTGASTVTNCYYNCYYDDYYYTSRFVRRLGFKKYYTSPFVTRFWVQK